MALDGLRYAGPLKPEDYETKEKIR